ncbi:ankyrin repeat domain-containing protein SOWAHA [Brachyhypopomus gauderio]|uniref:ankyrin repeat domain-containing protein SOWAHA n=1 Tax=Brachyhypopomus gauderio TaxID=698409 RepID=UPI0040410A44
MALTQGRVLSFLLDHGGKVKNSELLSNFKEFISCNDPLEKRRNRDLFKSFVNTVAVVKQIDDEKYVLVKKKYKEFVNGERNSLEAEIKRSSTSPNSSLASLSASERSDFPTSESDTIHNADVLNNNCNFIASPKSIYCTSISESLPAKPEFQVNSSADCVPVMPTLSRSHRPRQEEFLKVLNISNNTGVAKGGAVFAVVAVQSPSPPRSQHKPPSINRMRIHQGPREDPAPEQMIASLGTLLQEVCADRTVAPGNSSSHLSEVIDGNDLNRSPGTKRRQSVAPGSPALKRVNKVTKPDLDVKQSATFPLEPTEHEWLVKSATGHWAQISRLLLKDIKLAENRNFMSGFTALHWAAKKGNSKMVCKILLISRQGGPGVDVNAKSYDGYTPLHIAALHSHESVLNVLVHDFGADCNIRDNSGKKPYHYLRKDMSPKVREMLRDPDIVRWAGDYKRSDHEQDFSDLPKGFSTLSKLFQSKHRKQVRCRPSFHFISPDQDEDRRDSTFSSSMFPYN